MISLAPFKSHRTQILRSKQHVMHLIKNKNGRSKTTTTKIFNIHTRKFETKNKNRKIEEGRDRKKRKDENQWKKMNVYIETSPYENDDFHTTLWVFIRRESVRAFGACFDGLARSFHSLLFDIVQLVIIMYYIRFIIGLAYFLPFSLSPVFFSLVVRFCIVLENETFLRTKKLW